MLPAPLLSSKTKFNLKSGSKIWLPEENKKELTVQAFISLYQDLVGRRGLSGGSFDFQENHFKKLFELPEVHLFGVSNNGIWGSMACAIQYQKEIHLLHIVNSNDGLRSNASYVLMNYLLNYCAKDNIKLYLGGVPDGDDGGVLRFKKRWSNTILPTWLMQVILNQEVYDQLKIKGNSFFPAYRKNW